MNLNIKVKYFTKEGTCVCFKHAVKLAMEQDAEIEVAVDDFDSEYCMVPTYCGVCLKEKDDLQVGKHIGPFDLSK